MRPKTVIIGILGLWLIAAGYINIGPQANIWNDWIVGIVVAILGFSMANAAAGRGLLSGILGLWMIVSGFIPFLNHGFGARWDNAIVGVLLAIAGFARPRRREGAILKPAA